MTRIRAFLTAASAGIGAAVLAAGMPALAVPNQPAPKAGPAASAHPQPKCTAQQVRMHQANCAAANQAHPQPGHPKGH